MFQNRYQLRAFSLWTSLLEVMDLTGDMIPDQTDLRLVFRWRAAR